ncbi:MAG: nucleotidyltransferase substrate binding protein, partial [Fusobacteriaceae bacterium]
ESDLPFTIDVVDYKKIKNEKLKNYIDKDGKIIFLTNDRGEIVMNEGKLFDKLEDFFRALKKLMKVIEKDPKIDDAYLDATIQRFEFVYELSWKLMKSYLDYNGVGVTSPRETFRESFKSGIIDDATQWIKMMENRNRTSHTYDEATAWEIYEKIKKEYIELFQQFSITINEKIKSI